jgi:hypothetical protein
MCPKRGMDREGEEKRERRRKRWQGSTGMSGENGEPQRASQLGMAGSVVHKAVALPVIQAGASAYLSQPFLGKGSLFHLVSLSDNRSLLSLIGSVAMETES